MKTRIAILFMLCSFVGWGQGSYISRLWNTKSYDKIVAYSPDGDKLSARDNMTVGRAFMALDPKKPQRALFHYDMAIKKRMNSEDLYYFRSEANYELGNRQAALDDLEKCLEFRKDHQKYLLFKGLIEYEMGRRDQAYKTYFTLTELYDKQTPFYMLVVINLEREMYYKAQQQIEANMLRFERGKDFWRMTAEQQVDLEWRVFKDYPKSMKAQQALLEFFPESATYLTNELLLYRLQGMEQEGQLAENKLQERYNTNGLPLDYYKKGRIIVAETPRTNGTTEDYRTFRPRLFENTKYTRFFISNGGSIVGKQWAGLVPHPEDSTKRLWEFHRGEDLLWAEATDTNYAGFNTLFELPDSAFIAPLAVAVSDSLELSPEAISPEVNVPVVDTTIKEMEEPEEMMMEPEVMPHEEAPMDMPMEAPMEAPDMSTPADTTRFF